MLISEEYRKEQEILHSRGDYGVTAQKYGRIISEIIDNADVEHVLDFGCGKNLSLQKTLVPNRSIRMQLYDPGVPEYAESPIPAEMVVCCDVIEHVEPEFLEETLDFLEELTEVILFMSIHTGPAGKTLSDGRNAHLIQESPEWWLPKIMERFTLQSFQLVSPHEFFVVAHSEGLELC